MKNLFLVILIFSALNLSAQAKKKQVKVGNIAQPITRTLQPKATAVIKGNVKNFTGKYWQMALTGDLTNYVMTIPVDKDGFFNKTINLDDETEDIYLYLNDDAITICAQKGDTIEINWDNKNFDKTFLVSSPKEHINSRLQDMLSIYKLYSKKFTDLTQSLHSEKANDSVKFSQINALFNKEMRVVTADSSKLYQVSLNGNNKAQLAKVVNSRHIEDEKVTTDIYYKYTNLLNSNRLLPRYTLYMTDTTAKAKKFNRRFVPDTYKMESEYAYQNSNEYKSFLSNYISSSRALSGARIMSSDIDSKIIPLSATWRAYYLAMANFNLSELRDWFITKEIMFDFEYNSFDDASDIYKDYITKVKTPRYADSLKSFYVKVQQLKPGNMAPGFSLKNDKGVNISLKSLRGKVVYIDFWGVGCAPCVDEIKNYTAALHKKYKDKNIVFLNVCVDTDEKTWKQNIVSLKVDGSNVIAKGWTKNPVCKQYNINGIPHYIIIGADGKIVNNNSPRPSETLTLYPELDKALK
ncbi:MAG: TlpA family protein disulfide reductase [Bacteroidota bacterium]|nr:TlpA family protein disulfide reductase [Bacteroidota bacterium]